MKIYTEKGMEIQSPNLDKGFLTTEQRIVAEHPAEPEIPAVTHVETMDGTDGLKCIVEDSPAIPAKEAWTEYETVQIYHEYTPAQLAERSKPTQEERLTALENCVLELMLGGEPVV